jgi:hypothetical protein
MTALDIAGALNALKTFYSKDRIEALVYRDRPLFAMLDKKTDFVGDKYKVPMIVARPQGIGSTFATAQTNKTATNYQAFYLERVKHYALASITTEAVLASQNDAGAFLRLATGEIDGAIDGLTRVIARQCYGDSSAALGQIGSITSAAPGVITLKDPEDVVAFEVGQVITPWNAKSGGANHLWSTALGVTTTIVGIDRNAGTLTIGTTSGGGLTAAADDYLFVSGDRGLGISGVSAWIPASAPSSASFFGMDRTVDSTRMAGQRVDCSALPIEEALIVAARKTGREGGQPSHCFLSFDKYAALEKSLGTKVRYCEHKVGELSFQSIKVNGPKGDIAVLADQDCPNTNGFLLDMKQWSMYSLGPAVQILDLDGNKMLRESTADAMEIRIGFFGNVGCRAPGFNCNMQF